MTRGEVEVRDGNLIEGRWNFTDIRTIPSVVIQVEASWDKTSSRCRVLGYKLTPTQRTRAIAGKPLGVCVNYLERDETDTRRWRLAGYKDKESHELCRTMQDYLDLSRGNINNVLWCEKKTKVDLKQDLTNPKVFPVPEGCVEVPIE